MFGSMTKRQWAARFFQPLFSEQTASPTKAPRREPGRQPVEWAILLPGGAAYRAITRTKSEARAQVKRLLQMDRLPAGTECLLATATVAA